MRMARRALLMVLLVLDILHLAVGKLSRVLRMRVMVVLHVLIVVAEVAAEVHGDAAVVHVVVLVHGGVAALHGVHGRHLYARTHALYAATVRTGCGEWGSSGREAGCFGVRLQPACGATLCASRGEGSSRCSGCLFDGAGVLVLMVPEGGASGEGLLAVGVGTPVGALSSMNTAMAGEGAGIAKGLIMG
jgi:hypothetical protein